MRIHVEQHVDHRGMPTPWRLVRLSVSVYAPLSRSCAMNPRMAMDCIAWARMPTAAWSHRRGRCSHRTTIPGTGTRELEGERRVGWQRGKFKGGAVGDFVLGLEIGGSIAIGIGLALVIGLVHLLLERL